MAIGLISFFSAFGSFGPPRYFWCAFVGMPLIAVGAALSKFGYMGAVGRYVAGEIAPVAKDSVNYMAVESKDAIRHVAEAVGSGLSQRSAANRRCPKCNVDNQAEAKFCNDCGAALMKNCAHCGKSNAPTARFCDKCGQSF